MFRRLFLSLITCLPSLAWAMPFRGAKYPVPPESPPDTLKPGEFVRHPGVAPGGRHSEAVAVPLEDLHAKTGQQALENRLTGGIDLRSMGMLSVAIGGPGACNDGTRDEIAGFRE